MQYKYNINTINTINAILIQEYYIVSKALKIQTSPSLYFPIYLSYCIIIVSLLYHSSQYNWFAKHYSLVKIMSYITSYSRVILI